MLVFFFFKQKTAYEMRISDWSSDVCSSDLVHIRLRRRHAAARGAHQEALLDQEGLDHVLEGAALFAQRGGQRLDPDRAAVEGLHDDAQQIGSASCRERVCQYV